MKHKNLISYYKHLVILIIFSMMMMQSVAPTLAIFFDTTYELVQIDREEDLDEKEKQEDSKENKVKVLFTESYATHYNTNMISVYGTPVSMRNSVTIEIPIPPPDVI